MIFLHLNFLKYLSLLCNIFAIGFCHLNFISLLKAAILTKFGEQYVMEVGEQYVMEGYCFRISKFRASLNSNCKILRTVEIDLIFKNLVL